MNYNICPECGQLIKWEEDDAKGWYEPVGGWAKDGETECGWCGGKII